MKLDCYDTFLQCRKRQRSKGRGWQAGYPSRSWFRTGTGRNNGYNSKETQTIWQITGLNHPQRRLRNIWLMGCSWTGKWPSGKSQKQEICRGWIVISWGIAAFSRIRVGNNTDQYNLETQGNKEKYKKNKALQRLPAWILNQWIDFNRVIVKSSMKSDCFVVS